MANKQTPNIFGESSSLSDEMDIITGVSDPEARAKAAARVSVTGINIYSISPDKSQPRRALPIGLRYASIRTQEEATALFSEWSSSANIYGQYDAVADFYNQRDTQGNDSASWDEKMPEEENAPELSSLRAIVALAASIYRSGLINPIAVVRSTNGYVIESGERRWLAHCFVHAVTGESKFTTIPSRVFSALDRFRQASENGARENLSAISKARQLALLIMESTGKTYSPIEHFPHERQFYAQVADGKTHRIPNGASAEFAKIMGLKNEQSLRLIRALLTMPNECWDIADSLDMTENRIRTIAKFAQEQEISLEFAFSAYMSGGLHPPVTQKGSSKESVEISTLQKVSAIIGKLKPPANRALLPSHIREVDSLIAMLQEYRNGL